MAGEDWIELPSTMTNKQVFVDLPKGKEWVHALAVIEKVFWDPNKERQVLEVREYGKADSWYILNEAIWKGLFFEGKPIFDN